jgi:hypothetical protein
MKNIYKSVIVTVSSKIQGYRPNRKILSIEDVALYCHLTIDRGHSCSDILPSPLLHEMLPILQKN